MTSVKLKFGASSEQKAARHFQTTDGITVRQVSTVRNADTVFTFFRKQIAWLQRVGRQRTSETYQSALNSLMRYRGERDLYFEDISEELTVGYESWMKSQHLCRNTTSFYMRILRTVCNRAAAQLACESKAFCHVYTGIDKTAKRAISLSDIRHIKMLALSENAAQDFARDIFLLSFYLRGMSFVDLAFLRKIDLNDGFVSYCRRKTGQHISIRWEHCMQEILDKYGDTDTQYLLPIIRKEDGTELRQYRNQLLQINRKLKKVAVAAKMEIPLTLYVARHSWASIAKSRNISVSVISEALGHDSEMTTQIYLASIQTSVIDDANRSILRNL